MFICGSIIYLTKPSVFGHLVCLLFSIDINSSAVNILELKSFYTFLIIFERYILLIYLMGMIRVELLSRNIQIFRAFDNMTKLCSRKRLSVHTFPEVHGNTKFSALSSAGRHIWEMFACNWVYWNFLLKRGTSKQPWVLQIFYSQIWLYTCLMSCTIFQVFTL